MAIRRAMKEVSRLRVKRQVIEALRQGNGPNLEPVENLPINSDVLIWRYNHNSTRREGPFKLQSTEGDTCSIHLPNGHVDIRITSVKPFFVEDNDEQVAEVPQPENHFQMSEKKSHIAIANYQHDLVTQIHS